MSRIRRKQGESETQYWARKKAGALAELRRVSTPEQWDAFVEMQELHALAAVGLYTEQDALRAKELSRFLIRLES